MLIEFKSIVSRNPSPCRLFIFTGRENVTSKAVANSTVHRWTSHRCNEPPLRFESHTDQNVWTTRCHFYLFTHYFKFVKDSLSLVERNACVADASKHEMDKNQKHKQEKQNNHASIHGSRFFLHRIQFSFFRTFGAGTWVSRYMYVRYVQSWTHIMMPITRRRCDSEKFPLFLCWKQTCVCVWTCEKYSTISGDDWSLCERKSDDEQWCSKNVKTLFSVNVVTAGRMLRLLNSLWWVGHLPFSSTERQQQQRRQTKKLHAALTHCYYYTQIITINTEWSLVIRALENVCAFAYSHVQFGADCWLKYSGLCGSAVFFSLSLGRASFKCAADV